MTSDITSKIRNLPRNWIFWLLIVTAIAIIIRSIPAWTNVAWGSDFGIYFGLAKDFVKSGELYNPYYGWGSSYNYFPVLYSISGFAHWITGIDLMTVMTKIAPIFGGLTVLIFYFLVYELLHNRKIAILSSLILAVLPFHVYQLSHAAPLTIGHFFMILSLYFFVKYRKKTIYLYPLFISTVLLIMSHHLTTYFYLISLIFIVFFENASKDKWTLHLKKDVFYILLTSILVFSYWAFIATPVYDGFMNRGLNFFGNGIGAVFTIFLFYSLFFASFGVARLTRRFSKYLIKAKESNKKTNSKKFLRILYKLNPFIRKKNPSLKSRIYIFVIALISYVSVLIYFTHNPLFWQGYSLNIEAVLLITPFLVALDFALAGFRYTSQQKNGFFIRGWTFALLFSLLFAMITNNRVLLPHRHLEYLMYPIAIISVFGIGSIFSDPDFKEIFSNFKESIRFPRIKPKKDFKRLGIFAAIILIFLVVSNAALVYPAHESLNQSHPRVRDEIYAEDISVINWMTANLNENYSLIVSDHCLERMIEAEDFITTEDQIEDLWSARNFSGCLEELFGIGQGHSKITHVVIDKFMKEKFVQYGLNYGKPRFSYMTNKTCNASYDKFLCQPFELIYSNESIIIDPLTEKPIYWAEIYQVNWTYINERLLSI